MRSIALDTSSRTSVALVRVLCKREFQIAPRLEHRGPDLDEMLATCDAALIIGDNALMRDGDGAHRRRSIWARSGCRRPVCRSSTRSGPAGTACLSPRDVEALQGARDRGLQHADEIARENFASVAGAAAHGRALSAG